MAKFGKAPALGAGNCRFESCCPDANVHAVAAPGGHVSLQGHLWGTCWCTGRSCKPALKSSILLYSTRRRTLTMLMPSPDGLGSSATAPFDSCRFSHQLPHAPRSSRVERQICAGGCGFESRRVHVDPGVPRNKRELEEGVRFAAGEILAAGSTPQPSFPCSSKDEHRITDPWMQVRLLSGGLGERALGILTSIQTPGHRLHQLGRAHWTGDHSSGVSSPPLSAAH